MGFPNLAEPGRTWPNLTVLLAIVLVLPGLPPTASQPTSAWDFSHPTPSVGKK